MPMTYLPETGTRFWYQKPIPESGISFWYQLQLEAKFLVPETNMADDADDTDAVCAMAETVVKQTKK